MSHDAITLLKEDHREVKRLFTEFERQSTTDARRRALVKRAIELLTVHTYLENEVMYPEVLRRVPDLQSEVLESYEEHHVADVLAAELAGMDETSDRYFPKFTVLMENVRHHVEEEESGWFPVVREALSRTELSEIGSRMLDKRRDAPTSPAQPGALSKAADALGL